MGETKEDRAVRLAAALRENLKRRKAQGRERAAGASEPRAEDTSDGKAARGAEG